MYIDKLNTIKDLLIQLETEKGKKNKIELLNTLIQYVSSSIEEYSKEDKTFVFSTNDLFVGDLNNKFLSNEAILGFATGKTPVGALTSLMEDDPAIGVEFDCETINAYEILPCYNSAGVLVPVEELILEENDEND